ncbi:MAG: rhodanese-like domain-containing protein [Acidobacteriota bacterium]|nr:rhodanese-like domain-containing protein [Acidobacteriota bacterium]
MLKNSFVRAVVLIAVAAVLAVVTNGFASRTRRLMLPGYYPNALKVPPKEPERVPPPPPVTATTPPETATIEPVITQTVVPVTSTTSTASTTSTTSTSTAPVTPATTPTPAPTPPADPLARFKPHPSQAYVEISGADAAALYAAGVLFLDARRTSVFEEGHIAGARSFSVWESDIDDKVNALYEERSDPRDQDRPIVIYCSGGACEDSHMLSQKLWGIQFNNIYVYKDGFPDWQNRGGAVKTGAQP